MTGKHEKKKEEKNKRKSKFILFIGLILFAVYFISGYFQYQYHLELLDKERVVKQEIENEKNKTKELEKKSNYNDSNEYIEKIARERLNLVKSNEIMFIDKNK